MRLTHLTSFLPCLIALLVLGWSFPAEARTWFGGSQSDLMLLLWVLLVFPVSVILLGVWWMGRVVEKGSAPASVKSLFGGLMLGLVVACFVFCPGYVVVMAFQSSSTTMNTIFHMVGMCLVSLSLEWLLFRQGRRLMRGRVDS